MKNTLIFALIFTLLPVFGQETFEKDFEFRPGDMLDLSALSGGHLEFNGWDGADVRIAYPINENTQDLFINEDFTESGLKLSFDQERKHKTGRFKIKVFLPVKSDLNFYTAGGNVSIKDLEGALSGKSMGGHFVLENFVGVIDVSSMGGNMSLENTEMHGSIDTMGGNINLEDMIGVVNAKTMGGNINYENMGTTDTGQFDNMDIIAHTKGGNISLYEAPVNADMETNGGSIQARYVGGNARAHTLGGNVFLHGVGGSIDASTSGGKIFAVMTDSDLIERGVNLVNKGGKVELVVPRDLSMSFDVEVISTRNSKRDYRIETPFDLNETVEDGRMYKKEGATKVVRGFGELNGGDNLIKIKAYNGDVKITYGRE